MSEGGAPRLVEVSPERYPAWRSRFDGANATKDEPQRIVAVDRFDHDPLGLVLVRRGGYAVGLVAGGVLVAHKIGTAHVQGRTKKGGWSQQRYARRRGHQSDEVVDRCRERVVEILLGPSRGSGAGRPRTSTSMGAGGARVRGLGLGGDRALIAQLLDDPRLAPLRDLPRRELYDLPDPTRQVLETALTRTVAVRVSIVDPA